MNSRWRSSMLLGLGALGGIALTAVIPLVQAQNIPNAVSAAGARFLPAAWGVTAGTSVHHGCYLVDTQTGELWYIDNAARVTRVSGPLKREP